MMSRREFVAAGVAGGAGWLSTRSAGVDAQAAGLDAGRALALARGRRDELVDLLTRLIAVSSPLGESADAAQQVAADYLRGRGYAPDIVVDDPTRYTSHPDYMAPATPYPAPATNLVGRPASRASRVALFAHIDTERAGGGWTGDPLRARVEDGRLYGLGAADDKGGVAAMLVAAAILQAEGRPSPVVLSLHGKGGGSRGSLPTFARLRDFSQVLYVHPAETGRGLADIKHVVRGVVDLRITVTGWRGRPREIGSPDSAPYAEGGNALDATLAMLDRLRTTAFAGGEVNVGELKAGDRVGSVPHEAYARVRVLWDDQRAFGDILAATRRECDAVAASRSRGDRRVTVTVEREGLGANYGAVDWDSPSCTTLRRAIAEVTGTEPASYPTHFAGDIRYPIRLSGVPAFGIGSLAGGFYGPDEWVDLDDLVRLVAVVALAAERWA
ncbi:MAG: M20 family metallopeptidase [Acidobacteria bacterium]|nr:M20 family metallopeptidase [Acidobacteriota bacterium]